MAQLIGHVDREVREVLWAPLGRGHIMDGGQLKGIHDELAVRTRCPMEASHLRACPRELA